MGRPLIGPDQPLPAGFYARSPQLVARDLLGAVVTDGLLRVRLVEVEAYEGPADPASHSYRGRTARNAVMWGAPGSLYVYFTYGMHWCMNVSCAVDGVASAVLLRAGEVLDGSAGEAERRRPQVRAADRGKGPARLARLLGVDGSANGHDVTTGEVPLTVLAGAAVPDARVRTGPRVGLNPRLGPAADWSWRWWDAGSPAVSRYVAGGRRSRQARSSP